MGSERYIVGDSLTVLQSLPDASVDLVMSSPPFLALRSYLPADHPDKAKEIGSEATPGEFLDVLLDIVVECRRVLAPHGSLIFELGDTYSGSGGAGGDYNEGGLRDGQAAFAGSARVARDLERIELPDTAAGLSSRGGRTSRPDDVAAGLTHPRKRPGPEGRDKVQGWPLAKCLTLIPQSFAWALAYGRNPFTGRTIEPWRVRNVVAWCRPNPPVGALGDKFRPATSYLTVACMSGRRYFDLDAVRQAPLPASDFTATYRESRKEDMTGGTITDGEHRFDERLASNPAGAAPPLDYWVIPTQPYKGSHYATYPTALCEKPIKAMVPLKVCRTCGEPSRRITEVEYKPHGEKRDEPKSSRSVGALDHAEHHIHVQAFEHGRASKLVETIGWTDCGHDDWRTGVVLDCFAGSGTTLEVATGHGRDAIGIDLDARNAELALGRVGPLLLTVEHHAGVEVA